MERVWGNARAVFSRSSRDPALHHSVNLSGHSYISNVYGRMLTMCVCHHVIPTLTSLVIATLSNTIVHRIMVSVFGVGQRLVHGFVVYVLSNTNPNLHLALFMLAHFSRLRLVGAQCPFCKLHGQASADCRSLSGPGRPA